jgi:signal transduction histidine kinase
MITLNGDIIYVESTGVAFQYKNELLIQGIFRDITDSLRAEQEREKLEAQLRQAQKMEAVGRLSGGVAHDFNNMLGVILGFTELAIMKLPADDPVQAYLEDVTNPSINI